MINMQVYKLCVKGNIKIMRTDFHSHILPEMDDGASSAEESVRMIKTLMEANVERIILTPHFYRENENIEKFLERRLRSYEKLMAAAERIRGCPELILGAEVYFHPALSSDKDFHKLCIGDTDFILLELPFARFFENFYSEYSNFLNRCEPKIIFAHIERYLTFGNNIDDIRRLLDSGNAVCQMNCGSIAESGLFKRNTYTRMISGGLISVIGTDAHNMSSRPPQYKKAEAVIRGKCGDGAFEHLCHNSDRIIQNRPIKEIL